MKIEADERRRTIIMRSGVKPPAEIFVRAGTKLTKAILKESNDLDEAKLKRLLNAIGSDFKSSE